MEFGVGRQGVGEHVESFLEDAFYHFNENDHQLVIYWVTFTVDCIRQEQLDLPTIFNIFDKLKNVQKNKPAIRIICRHPESNKFGSVINEATFKALQDFGVEVRGLRSQENALADQSDIGEYGKLHAKFLVSALDREPDQLDAENLKPKALLFGSFNFSVNSLKESCESFGKTTERKLVKDAFVQAKQMWNSAIPLTSQDCQEFVGLTIVPVHGTREIPSHAQTWDYPIPLYTSCRMTALS